MLDEITPKEEVVVEIPNEPVSEPVQAPETPTGQIPVSEPLAESEAVISEPKPEVLSEPTPEPIPEIVKEEIKPETSEPIQIESKPVERIPEIKLEQPKVIPVIIPAKSLARELLIKARNMIQFRKRKKLDKIMTLFAKQTKITNDEVEKFLHVSDATAERYLNTLEKENKIKQTGKTGKSVFYTKI